MATAKKGANKAKNKNAASAGSVPMELGTMTYWRKLANLVCPDIKDDFELGEVAIALQQICKGFSTEFEFVSKICNKNEDTKIGVGITVTIDRRTTPSEVSVKFGYAEKHAITFKSQVPDPNQDELPGIAEKRDEPEVTTDELAVDSEKKD